MSQYAYDYKFSEQELLSLSEDEFAEEMQRQTYLTDEDDLANYSIELLSRLAKYIEHFITGTPRLTEDLCRIHIISFPDHLCLVPEQTENVCSAAIEQDWTTIRYVRKQTPSLCFLAIDINPEAIKYIRNQDENICIYALRKNPEVLQYIHNQTYNICKAALEINGLMLQYVNQQTEELCLIAIEQNINAATFVAEQTPAICNLIVAKKGSGIIYVEDQTIELCCMTLAGTGYPFGIRYKNYNKTVEYLDSIGVDAENLMDCGIRKDIPIFKNSERILAPLIEYRKTCKIIPTNAKKENNSSDVSTSNLKGMKF